MINRCAILALVLAGAHAEATAQLNDRIQFNGQELFLSGSNVAWVDYARDVGPGFTDLIRFNDMFGQLGVNGGNSMRFWVHITGGNTPAWSGSTVVGPGDGTIDDLRDILDKAWDHGVGLVLCLWSFDMLRKSNGTFITDRSFDLLTDPTLTQQYIDNALTPMVEALAGHPAIIAWEIFNEPEGMSNEFGWDFNLHVPMAEIQRFINLTAGAIHRADPTAQVTNGSWAFLASSDSGPAKTRPRAADLDPDELQNIRENVSAKYDHAFTESETIRFYDTLHGSANFNYYTDDRLIQAGGDPDGTLDFYTVHYYEWAGTSLSPFHHHFDTWGLTKPLVIGEFYMGGSSDSGGDGDPDATYGIPYQDLYPTLYDLGYAGGWAWQWYNYPFGAEGVVNWPRILEGTRLMFDMHPGDVAVDQGLRIVQFEAEPPGVELGFSSELRWFVNSATSVTLDGEPVNVSGTSIVSPTVTTAYRLEAIGADTQDTLSQEVTVEVLAPNEVNRARIRPAYASTIETCCGPELTADLAFDGSLFTRWSSAWDPAEADADPDDEWIVVDMLSAYDVERVVLNWETAFGTEYDIGVSYDGNVWTTVHEERAGDGSVDDITLSAPVSARYVRMHGLARSTTFGFSLWEFEVYGVLSNLQPPEIALTLPIEGALLEVGADTVISAVASDPDGLIDEVAFFVDGELLGTSNESPFTVAWTAITEGDYQLTATTTDTDGISVHSNAVPVFVTDTAMFVRYEAESASSTGDVTDRVSLGASGRFLADVGLGGELIFDSIEVPARGEYLLAVRYQLPTGTVASDFSVVVNGKAAGQLHFNGDADAWYRRAAKPIFQAGVNTFEIRNEAGQIAIDYLDVSANVQNVATQSGDGVPREFAVAQNFPNPFASQTLISYSLPQATHVNVDVFDVTGRRIARLTDGLQAAGTHSVTFNAGDLASGVFICRVQAGDFVETRRMIVLK